MDMEMKICTIFKDKFSSSTAKNLLFLLLFVSFQKIHYTCVSEKATFQRATSILSFTKVHCSGECSILLIC